MSDLADWTDPHDPHVPADPEARERWTIDGEATATWALRRLAAARAELARIEDRFADERDRLDRWATDASRGPLHDADFFTDKLIEYRRQLEAADPKLRATYPLPGGALKRRKGSQSVEVTDEASFVEWATTNAPRLLTVAPSKAAIREDLVVADEETGALVDPTTGEQVPGVTRSRGADTYSVTTEQADR